MVLLRPRDGRRAHDLVSKSFLQLACKRALRVSEDMASRPYTNLNVLSKRRMNSATDSASFWAVCRKSCAAKARPPGSRRLRREVTAWSYVFLSSSSNKLHSCSARPLFYIIYRLPVKLKTSYAVLASIKLVLQAVHEKTWLLSIIDDHRDRRPCELKGQ